MSMNLQDRESVTVTRSERQDALEAARKVKHKDEREERQAALRFSLAQPGPPYRKKGHYKREVLETLLKSMSSLLSFPSSQSSVLESALLAAAVGTNHVSLKSDNFPESTIGRGIDHHSAASFVKAMVSGEVDKERIGTAQWWYVYVRALSNRIFKPSAHEYREVLPPGLDPATGDLKLARSIRKRLQLFSLACIAMRTALVVANKLSRDRHARHAGNGCVPDRPLRITDFGAGSGHLGLLLAFCLRLMLGDKSIHVTLLDRKGFGCSQAESRISNAGLSAYVSVVEQDALQYNRPLDLGVSLHSCGVLTDVAQLVCLRAGAAFVLCPCCYGQLNDVSFNGIIERPRSRAWQMEGVSREGCLLIASSADFSPQPNTKLKQHAWDFGDDPNYLLAKRSMQAIDTDRNALAREHKYIALQKSLVPITCSPKNNVIVGVPESMLESA